MQSGSLISLSPSFNSCSSSNLTEIAARVVEEFEFQEDDPDYEVINEKVEDEDEDEDEDEEEEEDFEFSFDTRKNDSTTISADEIFYNGQIRPIYPVFGREFSSVTKPQTLVKRLPLKSFFNEERMKASCSSSSSSLSSEADDLEGVAPETYCVWTPKVSATAEGAVKERKKSNSTGTTTSSKRWRFKELLSRSISDGKDTFVFLLPSKRDENVNKKPTVTSKVAASGGGCAAPKNKSRDRIGFFF